MALEQVPEYLEIEKDELPTELAAGELIVLQKRLANRLEDSYYGWQNKWGTTVGRLAVGASRLSDLDLDIFIIDISASPYAYGDYTDDSRRYVGGSRSRSSFDINSPVKYLDFDKKRVGMSQPGYQMDRPTDYPPTVYKDMYPVRMLVGQEVLKIMHRTLDPNNIAFRADWDLRQTVMNKVDEVLNDPYTTLADFVEAAGAELVYPKRHFPALYQTTIDEAAVKFLTSKD